MIDRHDPINDTLNRADVFHRLRIDISLIRSSSLDFDTMSSGPSLTGQLPYSYSKHSIEIPSSNATEQHHAPIETVNTSTNHKRVFCSANNGLATSISITATS